MHSLGSQLFLIKIVYLSPYLWKQFKLYIKDELNPRNHQLTLSYR